MNCVILSAGFHAVAPGGVTEETTEHDIAREWIHAIYLKLSAANVQALKIPTMATAKDKANFVNSRHPLFYLDLRFSEQEGLSSKIRILSKDPKDKKITAFYSTFNKSIDRDRFFITSEKGYFRGNPQQGLDFILEKCNGVSACIVSAGDLGSKQTMHIRSKDLVPSISSAILEVIRNDY